MNILMAPTNYAGQAITVLKALRETGVAGRHLLYRWSRKNPYEYETDIVFELDRGNYHRRQLEALRFACEGSFDVIHFWQRSFFYSPRLYDGYMGLDLPILRSFGKKIVHRFTGYDLRFKSVDLQRNPYSPFRYGFELPFGEYEQRKFIDYLAQHVDAFVVQDPEMKSYLPQAHVIPRMIDLSSWPCVGVQRTARPLVVHAPSNQIIKGTRFLEQAVSELREEGIAFDYQRITQMSNAEAARWYAKADIVVDQLLVGWHGIVTLEAMALGKPVVAYLRDDLLDDPLCPPVVNANPDTVKAALKALITDSDRRREIGEAGRRFVETHHAAGVVVQQQLEVYREVMSGRSPKASYDDSYVSLQVERILRLDRDAGSGEKIGSTTASGDRLGRRAGAVENKPCIAILSRKQLGRVTRVVRQAKLLSENGFRVVVVSLGLPHPELMDTTPEVDYLTVELNPFTRRVAVGVRRWHNKLKNQAAALKKYLERQQVIIRRRRLRGPLAYRVFLQPPNLRSTFKVAAYAGAFSLYVVARKLLFPVFVSPLLALLLCRRSEGFLSKYSAVQGVSLRQNFFDLVACFRQISTSIDFSRKAIDKLGERRIDVCQAHDNYALIAARNLARVKGARLVYDAVEISEHRIGIDPPRLGRWVEKVERRIEKNITRSADLVVTIGDGLADWYQANHEIARPLLLRNCRYYVEGFDPSSLRQDCRLGDDERLVVWFGYAYPEQGIETIVETAPLTADTVHFALLMVVSDARMDFYQSVVDKIRAAGLGHRVHILPPRNPNELIHYIAAADLGIIPRPLVSLNIKYSLPNKLLEMVMARLPVVASEMDDVRRLLQEYQIGATFDQRNTADIAAKIMWALQEENHRRLRAAAAEAARRLCWENEGQAYLGELKRLCRKAQAQWVPATAGKLTAEGKDR